MMPPPKRTFGMVILIIGLVFYTAGVVKLASILPQFHWSVDMIFYLVAGVAWVVPAGLLLRWAGRGTSQDDDHMDPHGGPHIDPRNDDYR